MRKADSSIGFTRFRWRQELKRLEKLFLILYYSQKAIEFERENISIPPSQTHQVLQVEVKYTEVHQFQARLFSMVGPRLLRTQD